MTKLGFEMAPPEEPKATRRAPVLRIVLLIVVLSAVAFFTARMIAPDIFLH